MKSRTLVKLAVQSIRKNKMRAALTMLGIIIGVAAVLVMVAVGYGARSSIREQINNLGTNMIVITPGAAQQGGVSQGAQAFPNLTMKDVEKIRQESQLVSAVSPVIFNRSQVIGPAGNWRTLINGVDVDTDITNVSFSFGTTAGDPGTLPPTGPPTRTPTALPEPATLLAGLSGLGLIGLVRLRPRRPRPPRVQ